MHVAIEIGIPFLWVDRHCIDQTNVQQKHTVIRNMDKIYSGANLTIISAAGEDPHHELPGVRGTARQSEFQLEGELCTYFGVPSPKAEVAISKWGSRGCMTYQEMLLSRRRLVFTSSQVYFQCTSESELESLQTTLPMVISHVGENPSYYIAFPTGVVANDYNGLLNRLREYYKRHLSFSEDTIDAFVGIINAFDCPRMVGSELVGHETATHFYGIPIIRPEHVPGIAQHTFICGLAYSVRWNGTPRPSSQKESTCMFPSWTWASIKANEAPGSLTDIFYPLGHGEDLATVPNQDVNVMLWDRHKGAVSLSGFTNSVDVYTDLQPWLDITTWAQSYTVTQPDTAYFDAFFDRDMPENAVQDLAKFEIFLLCLSTEIVLYYRDKDVYVNASGLLVLGTGQETYRRVGAWRSPVKMEMTNIPEEIQRLVVLARATPPPPRENGVWRPLRIESWRGPRSLAAAGWEQRTMRLV